MGGAVRAAGGVVAGRGVIVVLVLVLVGEVWIVVMEDEKRRDAETPECRAIVGVGMVVVISEADWVAGA